MDSRASFARDGNPRRKRGTFLLLGIGLLLVLGIGIVIGGSLDSDNGVSQVPPLTPDDVGPTDVIGGVPVGYARSEEGAVVAATNFARVMSGAFEDPDAYREAMQTLAAPQWAHRARQVAQNTIDFLLDRYGEGGSVAFVPVRYRVATYSADGATIELWGVALAAGPGIQDIEESWLIGTVKLVWVNNDWRVIGQQSQPGPTPRLFQTQEGADPERVLRDFEEYVNGPNP